MPVKVKQGGESQPIEIVHVGAHHAEEWANRRWATRKPYRLHLVEPNLDCVSVLRGIYRKNPNVSVYPVALSDVTGFSKFYIPKFSEGGTLFTEKQNLGTSPEVRIVPTMNACVFIRAVCDNRNFFLLSNCEGGELNFMPRLLDQMANRITASAVSSHEDKIDGVANMAGYYSDQMKLKKVKVLQRSELFEEIKSAGLQ